jgi:glycosyltransferase involved in cell wall biosynthesis
MNVIALIPAYNEADIVGATIAAVLALSEVTRVVVIDDGSSDDTIAVAKAAGAEVLQGSRNAGKGSALNRGIACLGKIEEFEGAILLLDADLGASAGEAACLLAPVISDRADMSIGRLPIPHHKAGFGFVKRLAHAAIAELGGGFDAQAPISGQRCISGDCLATCLPFAEGYGVEVALTVRALQGGWRLTEVPVEMYHRSTGRDLPGFLHRFRQYRDIKRTIKTLELEQLNRAD